MMCAESPNQGRLFISPHTKGFPKLQPYSCSEKSHALNKKTCFGYTSLCIKEEAGMEMKNGVRNVLCNLKPDIQGYGIFQMRGQAERF